MSRKSLINRDIKKEKETLTVIVTPVEAFGYIVKNVNNPAHVIHDYQGHSFSSTSLEELNSSVRRSLILRYKDKYNIEVIFE